jgi:hypothetical protein
LDDERFSFTLQRIHMKPLRFATLTFSTLLSLSVVASHASAGPLNIVINPGPTLSGNAQALAAFERAAVTWESLFSDPITVTINADLAHLGPGILGQASSVELVGEYNLIRDNLVADADADDGILAFLPTAAQLSVSMPAGFGLGRLTGTKANLKAIGGFGDLDGEFGVTDASITFSTQFNFDFDDSNGITAGQYSFETIASHEIGHALGFSSVVDTIDFLVSNSLTADVNLSTLDLFRFGESDNPSTPAEFTSAARNLVPNTVAFTDDLANEWMMSTGSFTGDGRQASHWKDNDLSGVLLGTMDPTFNSGTVVPLSMPDVRALDLIGWDFVNPEPATSTLMILGMMILVFAHRTFR